MSEFHVEVVRLGAIEKHPNADSLSITQVHGGYPVILRTGQFGEGDLATYVPIDALVPTDREPFTFLRNGTRARERIKAKRLRGVFSMGLLVAAPEGAQEGDDVREALGVEKWEPAVEIVGTSALAESPPSGPQIPVYDLEGLRKFRWMLTPGEEVVVTEKIHGANARFFHDGERLWAGSRTQWKREDSDGLWWPVARSLETALCTIGPNFVVFGEVYGQVQDLKYGVKEGAKFAAFDILNRITGTWLNWRAFRDACEVFGIPMVPVLYEGEWHDGIADMAEGPSTLAPHVREGIVVKPTIERRDPRHGRVCLKLAGQGYLLRKEAA